MFILIVTLEYLIKKPAVTMKKATVSVIKVKLWSAFWHVLMVCIRSYLKSVLRYKDLILDTHHPNTLYLRKQGYEDPWFFLKLKGVREQRG